MTELAVRCRHLHKIYAGGPPVEAVRGIDLEVRRGECFGVLGPNGAGKTTTIEILEGLLEPTGGEVEVLGRRWDQDSQELRERIGISLQETRLADKLSVRETLELFRSFYANGLSVQTAIERVGLQEKTRAWIKALSGGQKQRLAVAIALVGDPELLFLDEPTTGLDPRSRRQLWEVIGDLRNQGRSVVLTTHYMEEAERLCDRVAILDRGLVIALGTPRELIAGLGSEHVIEFSLADGADSTPEHWSDLPSVIEAVAHDGVVHLSVTEPHVAVPQLLRRLYGRNLELASLSTRHASLEDVFVKLTGRHLEEAEEEVTE